MQKLTIKIKDRLDRSYDLEGYHGQRFRNFLLSHYIPESSILLKVNGQIVDDQKYVIHSDDVIELSMVRAYQLPEYCQMLELWNKDQQAPSDTDSIYTNKILWFNKSGVCDLKQASIKKDSFPLWLENRFVEAINLAELIQEDDHICLPLSGGRDSLALLYLLSRTKDKLPKFSFSGVTVAPTVASIGDLKIASDAIKSLGVQDYHILDATYVKETMHLKAEFKVVMDKVLSEKGRGKAISVWHGIMKACIERFCREKKIAKIAYGYQFEDLMASLLRSNLLGLSFGDSMTKKKFGNYQLVFPIWPITKKELTIYLNLVAPDAQSTQSNPTQYDRGNHNRDIHYFLADMLSTLYPGIGFSMFSAYESFNKRYDVQLKNFCTCANCATTYPEENLPHPDHPYKEFCSTCAYFMQLEEIESPVCI